MGLDGGSVPTMRSCIRTMTQKENHSSLTAQTTAFGEEAWSTCAISKKLLSEPIVACGRGYLYRKDAVISALIAKKENAGTSSTQQLPPHITMLRDVVTLQLTRTASTTEKDVGDDDDDESRLTRERVLRRWVCPLSNVAANGIHPFVFFVPCGHVVAASGLEIMTKLASTTTTASSSKYEMPCPLCADGAAGGSSSEVGGHSEFFHIAVRDAEESEKQLERFKECQRKLKKSRVKSTK
eukprot:PhM_4_TR4924/c0_g1_i1/m.89831